VAVLVARELQVLHIQELLPAHILERVQQGLQVLHIQELLEQRVLRIPEPVLHIDTQEPEEHTAAELELEHTELEVGPEPAVHKTSGPGMPEHCYHSSAAPVSEADGH
jgi:hypothetical protein